ncbi:P-loop containing nucleoside triphosphate hydrolase [Parasponia andersonii]|uniref:P-loop containing nucleoside triphosphate hydrolase n=1 Tax=Parasponia andersonii TaxID=3476 RepID=A0A2P5ASP9_PARAD|nr:P-loop containing nucleoside triphosphate hydrolase [Parasponia andersonii]
MKGEASKSDNNSNKKATAAHRFTDTLFSWSLQDVFNQNLFKNKVEKIPESFQSAEHYLGSYVNPLLEETRAELHSSMEMLYGAPFAEVIAFEEAKPYGTKLYEVRVNNWSNRFSTSGRERYKTLPGDVFVLANGKPETVGDLQRAGMSWAFLALVDIRGDGNNSQFKVKASKEFRHDNCKQTSLYVIYLVNVIPHIRIWEALHMSSNLEMVNEVLCIDSAAKGHCDGCFELSNGIWDEKMAKSLTSELNESQTKAVLSCLHMVQCKNKSSLELIWGPPGTGKTKTVSTLLVNLMRMNYKTLICTPTNVAITEVASRVMKMVLDTEGEHLFCSLGDIVLFGTKESLNIDSDVEDIYLDYRVQKLGECFGSFGWRNCLSSMVNLLENSVSQYRSFLENDLTREKKTSSESRIEEQGDRRYWEVGKKKLTSFLEYVREKFVSISSELKRYISIICTHTVKSYISEQNFKDMVSLVVSLDSFESLLFQQNVVSEVLEELFSRPEVIDYLSHSFVDEISLWLFLKRSECLTLLKTLYDSLNRLDLSSFKSQHAIMRFCFQSASLILCTVSSSSKLHKFAIKPTILVIDEAAQLKECESTIPLQLPGVKHAILVGDECQLPATVKSRVCEKAGFGRSLFERLSSQNHPKHLLNKQYRMHPSISSFPNSKFYHNQILDAAIVERKSYEKEYLPGSMFGPYSFINVIGGREEKDEDGHSRKNMVEVTVILKILQKLYKAWLETKRELSIGVVSPYAAQVIAVQDKLGKMYDKIDGFQVKVKTIDGFQGGEEDVIIMSTVCCSDNHSLDFISNHQRINVALTRARHCLWILGNERTLAKSQSLWGPIILDAKIRRCFFDADGNEDLAEDIIEVKKEFGQVDTLLNIDSLFFKSSKWKVFFSDNFLNSFEKLTSLGTKKSVINLLLKLSDGWRPRNHIVAVCRNSLQIKSFKIEGLCVVSTVEIVQRHLGYVQVLKIWDLLPNEDTPRLINHIDCIFENYTEDFIKLCNENCFEGELEIPKSWPPSLNVICFKDRIMNEAGNDFAGTVSDHGGYVQNSSVGESSLPMKFYSLSNCVVHHMLSDRDVQELDFPFEVSDQERDMILFNRSTFILGRSGTGKTTVLTMKLFQKEYLHDMTNEGFYGFESNVFGSVNQSSVAEKNSAETGGNVLRQLFVTATPGLCNAVKQRISYLRSSCSARHSADQSSLINMDDTDYEESIFKNIPDSFRDIPCNSYPLVITYRKFLMMLDGTLSKSFFQRFLDEAELSQSQMPCSRSHMLQSFLSTKEVNYERFSSQYWPHFDSHLTKKLDPSRVFTEIISHIKGGLKAMEASDGKLTREDYVKLSKGCPHSLSRRKTERIYHIFQIYEEMKKRNGEFDLTDFVNGLHSQLRRERYEGDEMHFVYIDEVQHLTMSQVALFRHVCSNVEEGFVFSGDALRSMAGGIDCNIQDIRSLYDDKFILESKSKCEEREEKGQITNIFHLTQNFHSHAGILKLSQSILELCYCFFPLSLDIFKYETTELNGEAPIMIQSGNNENALITLFGKNKNISKSTIGFGAEQVILVRDENSRQKIKDYVGKQALILTIYECRDLEFQDVLLYNFFGSSPLREQWKVICNYTNNNLFDSTSPNFPVFDKSKHSILLAELKQLYVAVARTKQRLWICDNSELSKPMFDYWTKKCLVQVRQLDDSFALAMQASSSPQEWKSRGIKLYCNNNYEMATICFEKACDTLWERKSKAAGLKAMADCIRSSNPQQANYVLGEAAEIFQAIGKADSAARCFFDLGEYERAGWIYLENFFESELQRAGECFTLAGRYDLAANAYARGNLFAECLNVCTKGKLFSQSLAYIERWKQHAKNDGDMTTRAKDVEKIEQELLENCALHCYELKDTKSMMTYVEAFKSMNLIRNFLRPLGCFDELMSLEEKSGNFVEAAEIAKLKGDVLVVIDLLEKAGKFKEAATLILSYVLASSLWSSGKKGWPLKLFKQKDKLLTKATSFAKNETYQFYKLVCTDVDIMTNKKSDLAMSRNQMIASQRHKSVRGEILSARKILDAHLASSMLTEYFLEEELVHDLTKHSEDMVSKNQVSVESLVYFWNFWKDRIVMIFEYLVSLETQDVDEFKGYGEFCLNFLGVLRLSHNLAKVYVLMDADADWARNVEKFSVWRNGMLVSIDVCQLVSAAQIYWSSEVLSVGFMVLHKLEAIYNFVIKNSDPLFRKCRTLTLIYEVAQYLLESKFLKRTHQDLQDLQKLIRLSTDNFSGCVFPLDWRKSLVENLVSFRETDFCMRFLKQVIVEHCNSRNKLSYRQIGTVATFILGSGKLDDVLFEKILERMDWSLPWKAFFEILKGSDGSYFPNPSLICRFHEALIDAYNMNCKGEYDCMSPGCFSYLVERFVIWSSSFQGYFITTKTSFIEWLMYQEIHTNTRTSSDIWDGIRSSLLELFQSVVRVIHRCLSNKGFMIEWIKRSTSNENESYSLLVPRMFTIICLLYANFGICLDLLSDLLGRSCITEQLPWEFCDTLRSQFQTLNLNVLYKAFKQIDNHLVIVSFGENGLNYSFPGAIFVDMEAYHCKNDIIRTLFSTSFEASEALSQTAAIEASNSCRERVPTCTSTVGISSESFDLVTDEVSQTRNKTECYLPMDYACFWEIFEGINEGNGKDQVEFTSNTQTLKENVEKYIHLLTAAIIRNLQKSHDCEETITSVEMVDMLDDLKQLSAALDLRKLSVVKEVSQRLQSRRLRTELVLNQLFLQHTIDIENMTLKAIVESGDQRDKEKHVITTTEKISNSDKGKSTVSEPSTAPENKAAVKTKKNDGCHIL